MSGPLPHYQPRFTAEEIAQIQVRMQEIVDQDEPIVKRQAPLEEVIALFSEGGYQDKVNLLKYRQRDYNGSAPLMAFKPIPQQVYMVNDIS